MGRRATACRKCAAIKAKCTGQAPCSRCQRLGLLCSLANTPSQGADRRPSTDHETGTGTTSPSPQRLALRETASKPRVQHTKSSTGCANCRRRRKKCDEKRPACGDCERLNLQCLPRSGHGDSYTPTDILGGAEQALEIYVAGSDSDEEDEVPPVLDWLNMISGEDMGESSTPLSSLAHSNALKVLPDKRASDTAPSDEGVTLPSIVLSNYAGIDPVTLDSWTTGERHLLNHFLQSVARSMSSTEDKHNPFIHLVVPMAFESTMVRNALAALSATHLSKVYPAFERNHLLHRDMALEDLKWRLGRPETTVSALAATLLLCLCEICECHPRWLLYLHGARALLEQIDPDEAGPPTSFMIDLYNYICCVGFVTSRDVPRPWGNKFGLYSSEGVHALYGYDPDLYKYLARINRLSRRQSLSTDPSCIETCRRKALALEAELQNRRVLHDVDSEEKAAACAICWALILRLKEIAWPGLDIASAQTQGPVSNIISALSLIRPGSRAESHLLFPIFMAGVGSITKASRLDIEYRVNVAERTIGSGSVIAVHRILDELWRRENNGGKSNTWQEIVRGKMAGLMLF